MGKSSSSKKQKQPKLIEDPKHLNDSDDSEIDEDEAFNSEDERMYGDFFPNHSSSKRTTTHSLNNSDSGSDIVSDTDDDEHEDDEDEKGGGDGGQYMLSLLDKLSSGAPSVAEQEKEQVRLVKLAGRTAKESEFGTHAATATTTTSNDNHQTAVSALTMDQLMSGISDTAGFRSLQEALGGKDAVNMVKATTAPVANAVSERLMRKVQYRNASRDIKLWDQSTKEIREADTLDFRPVDKARITRADLVSKFEPSNDFEKEMAELLHRAGAKHDKEVMEQESKILDDLGESGLTLDDIKKRQAALSEMRSLLFYEEQKRNKINKIKSKKYRKIRKKQNERAKGKALESAIEADPELARELAEKEEMERMEERMTLSHKNTSKWAKQQLRRGANMDKETKQALSAQVKLGDDLRKKMNGIRDNDSDDDNDLNHELSNDELVAKARAVLDETSNDIKTATLNKKQGKGLHDMAFMKRGLEIQRERAKVEAKQLLQELEEDNIESDDDDEKESQKIQRGNSKPKATSAAETANVLPKGKLVASALELANSNTITISDGVSIEIGVNIQSQSKTNPTQTTIALGSIKDAESKDSEKERYDQVNRKMQLINEAKDESLSNPWIQNTSELDTKKTPDIGFQKNKLKSSIIDMKNAASILVQRNNKDILISNDSSKEDMNKATNKTTSLTQAELIERAFAAPTSVEFEAEFEAEKESIRQKDDPKRLEEEDAAVSGWGSWAGEGAPVPRLPKRIPKKLQPPEKTKDKPKRRRDDNLKTVIISEKRIKKNAQYCVDVVPYPYTSREQYERAMQGAMGREWNVTTAVRKMTRPEIISRAGVMINPISLRKKAKDHRAPAKF